jgi:hypothetical protein
MKAETMERVFSVKVLKILNICLYRQQANCGLDTQSNSLACAYPALTSIAGTAEEAQLKQFMKYGRNNFVPDLTDGLSKPVNPRGAKTSRRNPPRQRLSSFPPARGTLASLALAVAEAPRPHRLMRRAGRTVAMTILPTQRLAAGSVSPMSHHKRRISLLVIAMVPPKTATKSRSPWANARPKPRPASKERAISSRKRGAICTLFAN